MGELEYYVIAEDSKEFPTPDQRGYHESAPFAKFGEFRKLCMEYISQAGGKIKYGHSEVGNFSLNGKIYEQNEIEFLPVPHECRDQLMVARIIRNLASEFGLYVSVRAILPSAGRSGLHVHID